MRSILDVNVVIALLDPDHAFHERAHTWWAAHEKAGWASCPITENGVVRVMSHPGHSPNLQFRASDVIAHVGAFVERTNHAFWPDDVTGLCRFPRHHRQRPSGDPQSCNLKVLAKRGTGWQQVLQQMSPLVPAGS